MKKVVAGATMPDESTERHRQVLSALLSMSAGQTRIVDLLDDVLAELKRPVSEDDSFKRLEDLLQRTCDLLAKVVDE